LNDTPASTPSQTTDAQTLTQTTAAVTEETEAQPAETPDLQFTPDFTKISELIAENTGSEVVIAAQRVIEAFLQYETETTIAVSGNQDRFLTDMTYVIHCTCPIFEAFTDFSELTAYDAESGRVCWEFYVDRETFDAKKREFYEKTETYLSAVSKTDSEAMRAMLLYYAVIDDLSYDYDLVGENFETLSREEARMRSSSYSVLAGKSGICTNIAQAYMFLCTQADIACGTVLHQGGEGMHMWNIVKIDGRYYYCDPTWDANASMKHFGLTAADRADWAGGYSQEEGSMLSAVIPEKYEVSDNRFEALRPKLPVEMSDIRADKSTQTLTFVGYEYECSFACR